METLKAIDLRIGNLVLKSIKSGNARKVVDKIGCKDIIRINNSYGAFNYEPIPLTEEWLVKFGFEKITDFWILGTELMINKDFRLAFLNSVRFKHVHQLQNLYFALTNKELNYETK